MRRLRILPTLEIRVSKLIKKNVIVHSHISILLRRRGKFPGIISIIIHCPTISFVSERVSGSSSSESRPPPPHRFRATHCSKITNYAWKSNIQENSNFWMLIFKLKRPWFFFEFLKEENTWIIWFFAPKILILIKN